MSTTTIEQTSDDIGVDDGYTYDDEEALTEDHPFQYGVPDWHSCSECEP